jgi:heme exporter protein D
MIWVDWSEFLFMDGYGMYVWSACLAIVAALVMELLVLRWRRRSILDHMGKAAPSQARDDEATAH